MQWWGLPRWVRLPDKLGRKTMYLVDLAIFIAFSVLCAFAWNLLAKRPLLTFQTCYAWLPLTETSLDVVDAFTIVSLLAGWKVAPGTVDFRSNVRRNQSGNSQADGNLER